jgi:hypothetical protein
VRVERSIKVFDDDHVHGKREVRPIRESLIKPKAQRRKRNLLLFEEVINKVLDIEEDGGRESLKKETQHSSSPRCISKQSIETVV